MYKIGLKTYKDLYDERYITLCLFANKYINNLEHSKDIVQEVFIKIWEDEVIFDSESNVKAYLYTSVKNKCLDVLKSKRYKSTESISEIELEKLESEPFFLREVAIFETHTIIEQAINTLPNKCAQIIMLSIKSLTNMEIAKELNISINTVKAQKKIAYKRLKPILKVHFLLIAYAFDI